MKIVSGVLGGLVIAFLGIAVIAFGGAMSTPPIILGRRAYQAIYVALWVAAIVLAAKAPTVALAWRRLLIASAVMSFSLPLASIVALGSNVAADVERGGKFANAAITSTAIGGGFISGLMGFVGFFLGAIFLIIGLLVGRDRQRPVVSAPATNDEA